jgi:nitroreductase/NAD-dependent dihydropyrimidine dehydrogenase PreA subunit
MVCPAYSRCQLPDLRLQEGKRKMRLITVDAVSCKRDGLCIQDCPTQILGWDANGMPEAIAGLEALCLNCGHCIAICPHAALALGTLHAEELDPVRSECAISKEAATRFLKTRRSVRLFAQEPVPRDLLARVLDVTRWAPTATNRQPLRWLVVEKPEKLRELSRMIADGLRSIPYFERMVESYDKGVDRILRGAPQLVVAYAPVEGFDPSTDCTISLAYLDLAAHAHGLGTCWAGVLLAAMMFNSTIVSFLGIPEKHKVCGAMMIGYPRHAYTRIPERNPLQVKWM